MLDKTDEIEYFAMKEAVPSLPASWYYDPAQHERELKAIWSKSWNYVCRSDTLDERLAYKTITVGNQNVVVLRDREGALKAFYNTCRHRGSVLCTEKEGKLGSALLVCPYHQWSFAADDGRLVKVSSFEEPAGFDKADYGLFPVALVEWRGCVFINLDPTAEPDPDALFHRSSENLANFPMETMVVAHTWRAEVACNWKSFWENFNECLHCPSVHPELTELVPLYGRRIVNPKDLPDWVDHEGSEDPKYRGGLRDGGETWSHDGSAQGHVIKELTEDDLARGQTYATTYPSMFIGAYPDHARIVRLLPLGPEKMELQMEWLFPQETLDDPSYDIKNVVDFAIMVVEQDSKACEISQLGLHSAPFEGGVLMPEEYHVRDFHTWVKAELGK